ncbi:hypothetical protein TcasGA2_TC004163 [Tribolium castaneum]|uniref:Uncharacterized protein n=1 Tax=Tribolium castaneum TaxID=7070 RepID=D6W6S4_TRICA|nr:hypothetical protein TcasGA2_TC004163 [Tribolium castaneum]
MLRTSYGANTSCKAIYMVLRAAPERLRFPKSGLHVNLHGVPAAILHPLTELSRNENRTPSLERRQGILVPIDGGGRHRDACGG